MFWDHAAVVYDLFADIYNRKVHEELKRIVASELSGKEEVLECACGTGMLSTVIASRCSHLTATDFSENMLARTRKKCSGFTNVKVVFADILALDFADEAFDVVIAANVIHLLDDPVKALRELDRVCRPGGKLIIPTYMNREADGASRFSAMLKKAGVNFKQVFHLAAYRQLIQNAGYRNAVFHMIEGRVPCAVAVITKSTSKPID